MPVPSISQLAALEQLIRGNVLERLERLESADAKPRSATLQQVNAERRSRADRLLEALRQLEAEHTGERQLSAKQCLRRLAEREEWQHRLPALRTVQNALAQLRSESV